MFVARRLAQTPQVFRQIGRCCVTLVFIFGESATHDLFKSWWYITTDSGQRYRFVFEYGGDAVRVGRTGKRQFSS
jgi:hypothetical protein